jgi:hypothetical protein
VRHAGPDALDELEPLLSELRKLAAIAERKRGAFYRKSGAFLHFHEDPEGPFADLKVGGDWERRRVRTAAERRALLARARALLGAEAKR